MLNDRLIKKLEPASLSVLRSVGLLERALLDEPIGADRSLIVLGYFKIIEIELTQKIFIPYRAYYMNWRRKGGSQVPNDQFFKLIQSDVDELEGMKSSFDELVSFMRGGSQLSLTPMALSLKYAGHGSVVPIGNPFALLKLFIKQSYTRGHYLYGKAKLAERIHLAAIQYRNSAAHTGTFDLFAYQHIRTALLGRTDDSGLLNMLLKSLTSDNRSKADKGKRGISPMIDGVA